MEPDDKQPSEWSIEECEEFFASQDAITGLFGNGASITSFRPSPSMHNCGDCLAKDWFTAGIHVTSIVPPEQGWPIAIHCSVCRETTFLLGPWCIEPSDGGYWKIEGCAVLDQHNLVAMFHPL